MHEQAKLDEARHFLSQMSSTLNQRKTFNYKLSAFLAAARSVLQYANKEATNANKEATRKPGGQAWYDAQVAGKPIVKFLKERRDVSIHTEPIVPSASVEGSFADTVHPSDSVSCVIEHADGLREVRTAASSPEVEPQETTVAVNYAYYFDGWAGKEDLLTLCSAYLTDIERIVADGVANGFLTP